ncbi:MAG: hypothetical protein PUP91_38770 [Rhizonema sp. PD37]|nr:hypothetical protein [Rhizonema sp. PD37]
MDWLIRNLFFFSFLPWLPWHGQVRDCRQSMKASRLVAGKPSFALAHQRTAQVYCGSSILN